MTFTVTMHHRLGLVFAEYGGNVFFVQHIVRQYHHLVERCSSYNDQEKYGGELLQDDCFGNFDAKLVSVA